MTNFDIATACATRPEDRARQMENQLLNGFEGTLRDLRRSFGPQEHDELLSVETLHRRHAARAKQMNKAIARLGARLAAAGVR